MDAKCGSLLSIRNGRRTRDKVQKTSRWEPRAKVVAWTNYDFVAGLPSARQHQNPLMLGKTLTTFSSLKLSNEIQKAIGQQGYSKLTPIQAQAIPPLLEGQDLLGCAQTGTGKTAAFLLPILELLMRQPRRGKPVIRALILSPTRELAAQIGESFSAYAHFLPLKHLVIFGGVKQNPQVRELRSGVDVLIATPGRLLDLEEQGFIRSDAIEFFVLDEADRMLDMGFIRDIRRILKWLPRQRQNLLFSATMPGSIAKLASSFLNDPVRVEVDPQSTTVDRIEQRVMFVERPNKKHLLKKLVSDPDMESAIVFTRTKHGANRVARQLTKAGFEAAAIHGNKSQAARLRALAAFKKREIPVLVATDIASRGLDIDGVSHVFNYELPNIAESYVHRIGRTARAGRQGIAIALCDETETEYLRDIEKLIKKSLEVVTDHPWHFADAMSGQEPAKRPAAARGRAPRAQKGGQRKARPPGEASEEKSKKEGSGKSRRRRRPRRGKGPRATKPV